MPDAQDDPKTQPSRAEALEVARDLTTAFTENNDLLKSIVKRQGRTDQVLIGLAVVAILSLTSLLGVWRAQVVACNNSNDVRTGSLHIADTLEASLSQPRADGRERTPQEIRDTQAFIVDLREDFALLDCTPTKVLFD